MYRRRQRSNNFFSLILLGMLAGVAFLVYDGFLKDGVFNRNEAAPSQTTQQLIPPPTVAPDAAASITLEEPDTTTQTAANAELIYEGIADASLFIPAAGINAPIINVYLNGRSWDIDNLGMNIGHLQGTNWVTDGMAGNIVLSGHVEMRDGRRGVFEPVKNLAPGDLVLLRHGDEERRYSVTEIYNVEPDDLTPLYPTDEDRLTLITCDSYNFISDSYQERTVVIAQRIS